MEILFLGTSAGQPSKQRNVQSIALKLLDERNEIWLFDCGEATQHQILSTSLKPRKVSKIFISHLHGDHIFGLPGFLASRNFQSSEGEGPRDLDLYGPAGIKSFVMTALRISKTHLSYRIHFHEWEESSCSNEAFQVFEDDDFEVYAGKLFHSIFCLGYRIVEKDRVGQLDAEKLKADGLPFGPLFGKLKAGEDIAYAGQIYRAKDYIGEEKKGRTVSIFADTRKTDAAVRLAAGSDVLIHEATYNAFEEKIARKHGHSTSKEAAQVAREAGVDRLLLTHISARYLGADVKVLADQAKAIHPNTYVVKDFYEESILSPIQERKE